MDVNILYLRLVNTYSPMSLPPAISINGIWTQFVRYSCIRSDYLLSSFLFFFLLLSFLSFVFSSFNVIATPLLRFVSRIKIFVDEFRRETKRFIIYSNKLRIGTILSSLFPFLSNFLNGWIEEICEIRHKISSSALLQNLFWSNNLLIFQYILLPSPSLVMTPDLSRCGLQIASIPRRT